MIKVVKRRRNRGVLGARWWPECADCSAKLSVAKLLEATPLEIGRPFISPHTF